MHWIDLAIALLAGMIIGAGLHAWWCIKHDHVFHSSEVRHWSDGT